MSSEFLPAEIARLVCGYLDTNDLNQSKEAFLEESPADLKLRSFADLVDQGLLRNFDVEGLSLVDMLNEYKE